MALRMVRTPFFYHSFRLDLCLKYTKSGDNGFSGTAAKFKNSHGCNIATVRIFEHRTTKRFLVLLLIAC